MLAQLTGMRPLTNIWFGQFISLTASSVTQFTLTMWANLGTARRD
jgi:hypothetical protein